MVKVDQSQNKIIIAHYGTNGKYIDVLPIINKYLKRGIYKIRVNNRTFNKDPYYGKIKELVLTLENKDIIRIRENKILEILSGGTKQKIIPTSIKKIKKSPQQKQKIETILKLDPEPEINRDKAVYIGYDSSNYGQQLARDVCQRSIEKHNENKDVYIESLVKKELEERKLFWRDDNTGSTEFTYTRFLVPYLNNYKGWALFCDSDFLWFCDVNEVFEKYIDDKYAVLCVKHEYKNCHDKVKMDGQQQEWYPRKNWSSLMLFNCSHPSVKNLTLENINTKSPAWLHRMEWCHDEEIGEIDKMYNYLVNYYDDNNYKALHFTDGGPWHENYKDVMYGDLWLNYLTYTDNIKFNHNKKSNVLCVTTFNKELYNKYAHKFIETYNCPFDLFVYSENDIEFIKDKVNYNIQILDIHKAVPELADFINRNKERNVTDVENYGFRRDAIRFCYKVFAVTHAGLNFYDYDYLIWIDADTLFKKSLTENDITEMYTRPNSMMSYLGRRKKYHSDCGFLVFNMNHTHIIKYFNKMKDMYLSNDIYKEKEWHDSYIWDIIRKKFEGSYNITNFDIGRFYSNGVCKYNHVLTATPLFDHIDHLKGSIRKEIGTSDINTFTEYLNNKK